MVRIGGARFSSVFVCALQAPAHSSSSPSLCGQLILFALFKAGIRIGMETPAIRSLSMLAGAPHLQHLVVSNSLCQACRELVDGRMQPLGRG